MIKVVKFGGSSLANAEQFQKVKNIITAEECRRYVVPSAPGKRFSKDTKVTDMLYACYAKADADEDFDADLDAIRARYEEINRDLSIGFDFDEDFAVIRQNFADKIGKDYAASRGEYLNGKLLSAYLGFEFVDAKEVIFFDEHGNCDLAKTQKTMSDRLAGIEYAVIPGFYGCGFDGAVKTFSRGGSDITGSLVASAIHADMYENWTDVPGFLITDPRIVENPPTISTIT